MGPLSAVAVIVAFILIAITWIGWATISHTFLGAVLLIAAALILIDTFWRHRSIFASRSAPPQV